MNNNLVTKSNAVIQASYKLNLNEQRILLSCISQNDSRESLKENQELSLSAQDYSKLFGLELKHAYQEIRDASDNLFERHLWLTAKNGDPIKTRWISSVRYRDGGITLTFAKDLIPYLTELSSTFTSYRLENITKLTSIYAIRLYEMLIQWRKIGKVEFSLDDFRETLGIEKKEYPRMFDFKKHVLNIAIHQINENTDIKCRYSEVKSGRKITGFVFHFGKDALTQIELEDVIADAKKALN
ncbi:putative replication protein (plasmid) [Halobacteriovorax marinus SJ]|uniref:Replication protein n=1 Tax=Halobacteriovorax marinus (strain ATCC BAA-682 / DSM 15412 / SJ) TaxID=862908 RepID=K4Q5I6_HALMS|nr:replication initiation protein RepM [Halobacteriovorax marinus]CCE53505.1 putative replication protein [Halobacteriovorax marinus SJ]